LKSLLIVDLKIDKFSYTDAGQMHMYLNYAREHWMKPGENPPVGLILCAEKGAAEAHYALDNLPNKILAAEYHTILPDEKLIAEELERSRQKLEKLRLPDGRVWSNLHRLENAYSWTAPSATYVITCCDRGNAVWPALNG
jgi:hypothetical protein